MWKAGDQHINPVTGGRAVVYVGSRDTQNRVSIIDLSLAPNGAVAGEHLHPEIEEAFTVLGGRVGIRLAGEERIAAIGERLVAPPGTPHYWWNTGDEAARIMIEVRPPSRFEAMIDALFAMARDGQTDGSGIPKPQSRLEAFAKEFSDVIVFTGRNGVPIGADQDPAPALLSVLSG